MGKVYLGFDIGGTSVRANIFEDDTCKLGSIYKIPFKRLDSAKEEIETNICRVFQYMLHRNEIDTKDCHGIGLSLAANFDRQSGDIINWPNNRRWNGFKLKSFLEDKFCIPVVMEDDANCAAVGEHVCGSARGIENFVYITISTGIGCGMVLNGNLFTGANGWAGEIGHIVVNKDGPECTCGSRGCLQALASGPAILRRCKELAKGYGVDTSNYHSLEDIIGKVSTREFVRRSFNEAAEQISNIISYLIMTLDISVIVIGGGVTKAGSAFIDPLNKFIYLQNVRTGRQLELKVSELWDNAGVLGALNLIYKHANNGANMSINWDNQY